MSALSPAVTLTELAVEFSSELLAPLKLMTKLLLTLVEQYF